MSLGDYATGLAWLVVTWGAVLAASELLRRRRLAHLDGAPRVLALAVVFVCGLAGVHLLPLALGILSRPAVAVTALLLLAATHAVPRVREEAGASASGEARPGPGISGPAGRALAWAAALSAAGAGGLLVAGIVEAAGRLTTASDLTAFDLPVIGRWIQSGSAWRVTELFPFQTHGTYPHNGHLILLATMLPWHNDGLLRFAVYPFLALAALAVYGLGRELGAPRAGAALFGAVLVSVPVVATTPEFAPLDLIGAALFACGLVFLARGARTRRTSDLVLAGLGLGFGLGAKWYLAAAAAALLVTWTVAGLVARRGSRAVRDTLVVAGTAAAAGGFWLVRNWVEADDPLYPVRVRALGVTLWDAPPDLYRELVGFSLAHYLGDWSAWRHDVVPDLRHTLGVAGVLVTAGGLVALVAAVRARGDWRPAALAACVPVLVAAYVVTPYTAFGFDGTPVLVEVNVRYAIPALLAGAGACAWLAGRGTRIAAALAVLGLAAAAQGVWASAADLGASRALTACAAIALLALGYGFTRSPKVSRPAIAAVVLAALAVAGWGEQRTVNRDRYAGADPALDWVRVNARSDARIATTGYFDFATLAPAWPLFGARIDRRVEFIGPRDGGRVAQYDSPAAWRRAVARGGYDVLVVAQGRSPFQPRAREPRWAADAGWREVARSLHLVAYRLGGRR
jgi:hypothetical protein